MRIATLTAAAVIALLPLAATAQQPAPSKPAFALPPESITVTSAKPSDESIRNFVETRAAPTRFLGKMARWRREACPFTIGLGDKYAKYVTQRIRDVAAAVGAPVAAPGCRPNIQVVFTTDPQGFMDAVRKSGPVFLGYHDNDSQAEELAKVAHPIQAWYTTESLDFDGVPQVDRGQCRSTTTINTLPVKIGGDAGNPEGFVQLNLPCATVMHASGFRVNNGHDSAFYNVLIVAEPAKLFDYEVGSLADYIAMLALSQPASLDSCLELPSISNLLVKGCTTASAKITDGDLAYLYGLYRVPSGYALSTQQDEMRFEMKKTLVTDKGGAQ
ncbi:MAG TPA: hypothetical protein VGG66_08045 [Rhizomicrobium sp.]